MAKCVGGLTNVSNRVVGRIFKYLEAIPVSVGVGSGAVLEQKYGICSSAFLLTRDKLKRIKLLPTCSVEYVLPDRQLS